MISLAKAILLKTGDILSKNQERRRANDIVRSLAPELSQIVFLCKGNICRSPYAEQRFRSLLSQKERELLAVVSAGLDTTPGKTADPMAVQIAAGRGLDLKAHTTKRADSLQFSKSSLLIVMEHAQQLELGPLFSEKSPSSIILGALDDSLFSDIDDPFGLTGAHFTRTFDRIDQATEVLVRLIRVT